MLHFYMSGKQIKNKKLNFKILIVFKKTKKKSK